MLHYERAAFIAERLRPLSKRHGARGGPMRARNLPAPPPAAVGDEGWTWVLEVRVDSRWVLRTGPLRSYEDARWHLSDSLKESNLWRIRGGLGVGLPAKTPP